MSQPSVCAILLTADRPEMTRKAVECFRAQDYENRYLLIFDSGSGSWYEPRDNASPLAALRQSEYHIDATGLRGLTIGELRNYACAGVGAKGEIIVHWDSDDYSHPSRIAEQVALLQSSGADCVGYSDLLFWRESGGTCKCTPDYLDPDCTARPGEAWLYTSPGPKPSPPGTTLCYTREFWSRNPFPATSQGEELQFLSRAKVETISSLPENETFRGMYKYGSCPSDGKPRMIARIHGQNTSTAYDPRKMAAESKRKNPAWQRVPAWDEFCRSKMCANT